MPHSHDHHHGHGHARPSPADGPTPPTSPIGRLARQARYGVAGLVVAIAVASACIVLVGPGQALVITRFGNPDRVLTAPGLAWKAPAPAESRIDVDLRLRTTSSGLHDVGTRDGLRLLVQAYVAWQVPADADHVKQFVRAVRNQPDLAAAQLRSLIDSSLEITASNFDLAMLVNTNPAAIRIDQFEQALRQRLDEQALRVYGITIRQVGIERLTLPMETLNATVERMRAERQTVAAERSAEGQRAAAEIVSSADRDARILVAQTASTAAEIEAKARVEAARIYGDAYRNDPNLYRLLRSLDTLEQVIGSNSKLILRTDAAPFRVLVDGPGSAAGAPESKARKGP